MLNQGIRNANDGLSKLQIKDGALANIATLLDRMATLATQASSSSNGADIAKLQAEFNDIRTEIDREATLAELNSATTSFSVFLSSEATASNGAVSTTQLGRVDTGGTGLNIAAASWTLASNAQTSLSAVQSAISTLGTVQNTIGTMQNRLSFAISLAQSQEVNTRAAESRIRDANIAEESANMTRFNILSQSGIAALAQANQASSSVLALLR
jgi:flagellin